MFCSMKEGKEGEEGKRKKWASFKRLAVQLLR